MLTLNGLDEIRAAAGTDLGASSWRDVTQARITAFAQATDDHEAVHLDPNVAHAAGLPGTIAHGLYTLSLGPGLLGELLQVTGVELALNYGFDSVRWLAPVPNGARVRMRAEVAEVTEIARGVRVRLRQTFEQEGAVRPVCVADALVAWFDSSPARRVA